MGNKSSKSSRLKETNNSFVIYPPILNHEKLGKSSTNFAYLDINVSDSEKSTYNIGQIIKFELFREYPDFRLKAIVTSGKPKKKKSQLLNPKSHWFNVLMIMSEVEAKWHDRPFGFTEKLDINKDDIYLLAKAIWNYCVGYIYGIPIAECVKQNKIVNENIEMISRTTKIGDHEYIELDVFSLGVISGYSSWVSGGKDNYLINDVELTPLWRKIFGQPHPNKKIPGMFERSDMRLRVFIRFESSTHFSTFIHIASVNLGNHSVVNEEFMSLQIDALKSIIETTD